MRYQITNVNKSNGIISEVYVSNLGRKTKKTIINMINNGDSFYTKDKSGNSAVVRPVLNEWIRSVPDDIYSDNLGDLPPIPSYY